MFKLWNSKYRYNAQQYETRSFGDSICTRKSNVVEVKENQSNLLTI